MMEDDPRTTLSVEELQRIDVSTIDDLEEMAGETRCPEGCHVEDDGKCSHGYEALGLRIMALSIADLTSADKRQPIMTEDGVTVFKGDRAFNYYDGKSGIILTDPDHEGWFRFEQEGNRRCVLNGERIVSTGYAKRKGWM